MLRRTARLAVDAACRLVASRRWRIALRRPATRANGDDERRSVQRAARSDDRPPSTPSRDVAPNRGGRRVPAFAVRVDEFEGPFDLLLSLIAKHRLEVTELALHEVTDEFIALHHGAPGRRVGPRRGHRRSCVIAATLLDLKAARLLPAGQVEDEEDLALLEARDLLFARLLQYRAFKEVAALLDADAQRRPRGARARSGSSRGSRRCCPRCCSASGPMEFAAIAERALDPAAGARGLGRPHPRPGCQRPGAGGDPRRPAAPSRRHDVPCAASTTAPDTLVVVGALPGPAGAVPRGGGTFDQVTPLGELTVRWTGPDDGEVEVTRRVRRRPTTFRSVRRRRRRRPRTRREDGPVSWTRLSSGRRGRRAWTRTSR